MENGLAPENSEGEQQDGGEQLEDKFNGKSHDPERKEDQPDNWKKNNDQQGDGPAKDQQDKPQANGYKGSHSPSVNKSFAKVKKGDLSKPNAVPEISISNFVQCAVHSCTEITGT
jgi:hypothetical protein